MYIIMRLLAEFHYYFTPRLDKSKVREIVEFIARQKNIQLDSKSQMPEIYTVAIKDLHINNVIWKINDGMVDFLVEGYFPQWKRVLLIEGCRQNILVHALTHYIQFEYEPDLLDEKGKEREAWEMTKKYLREKHTVNFWILTIPLGIYCWWTSTPY